MLLLQSHIHAVTYPNAGSQQLNISRDVLRRINGQTYTLSNGTSGPSDTVTRSQSGKIISGTENGQPKSYTYDTAGRLTNAIIGSTTFGYSYGTEASSCTFLPSNNPNAGKNSNRISQTVNGTITTYCYNQADQLISSSDPLTNGGDYDTHGNMTSVGSGSTPLRLCYDSSDCNTCLTQRNSSGTGFATYYSRDVQGRIVGRYNNAITNWNYTDSGDYFYGYTGSGDTPDYTRDRNWNILEKYIQLPGNVLLTIRPQQITNNQKTYSLPNIHGDVFATTDAQGSLQTTTLTGPYGEQIQNQANPANSTQGSVFGYVGQYEKLTESQFNLYPIQMGARIYLASLGRFLQVDPVEGGTANNYVYVNDPVNGSDLTGEAWWNDAFSWTQKQVSAHRHELIDFGISTAAAAGTAACIASVACGIGVFAVGAGVLTIAGTGAHIALARQNEKSNVGKWAFDSGKSVTEGALCGRLFGRGCVVGFFKPASKSLGITVPLRSRLDFSIKNTYRFFKNM